MSEYEPGMGKSQNILIDILKVLRQINANPSECSIDEYLVRDWIYVSKNGDDTDGSTWEHAFTNIGSAVGAVPSNGDLYGIIIGPGLYDIDEEWALSTYGKNILFKGVNKKQVIITNAYPENYGVFHIESPCVFKDLTIAGDQFVRTLDFDGHNANYSSMYNCDIIGRNAWATGYYDGPSSAIRMSGANFCEFKDIYVYGEQGSTDAFLMINCSHVKAKGVEIEYCQYAVNMSGDDCYDNSFENLAVRDNLYAFNLVTGTHGNYFKNIHMSNILVHTGGAIPLSSIIDGGLDNRFENISITPEARNTEGGGGAPTNGVTLTSNGAADTWGVWQDIIDINDTPIALLYIRVANPTEQAAIYRIQVTDGVTVSEEIFEVSGGIVIGDALIRLSSEDRGKDVLTGTKTLPDGLPGDDRIYQARIMDSVGGASIDVYVVFQRF